jgi:transcription antitermination factor NusG
MNELDHCSSDPSPDFKWYAVQVCCRQEQVVSSSQDKAHVAFLSLYTARYRWPVRIAEVQLQLLPGCVFCHFDVNDRRTHVVRTPGLSDWWGLLG